MDKTELIEELTNLELDLKNNRKSKKGLWFRFYKNDTLATTIADIEYDRDDYMMTYIEECMQIAIDNPKGLQIYYS